MRSGALASLAAVLAAVCLGCRASAPRVERGESSGETATASGISAENLLEHIRTLASDEFGGRSPGSPGEEKTVSYLTRRFRALGLAPGNPDGTFVQRVPLVGITATGKSRLFLSSGGTRRELVSGEDIVAFAERAATRVSVAADVVFVGYGIVAPEYQWDDYKGVDVSGKVLIVLVNDPPVEDLFEKDAMTRYGRWTYKYGIAAAKGAAGALIVHETVPAGYPWDVVVSSWTGEQLVLWTGGGDHDRRTDAVAVEGWLSLDSTRVLFARAGLDFEREKKRAASRSFRPIALGARLTGALENEVRPFVSSNVVAKIEGGDRPEEVVLYVAHWDHLGTHEGVEGDRIFHGAYDNATGTAGLLELAHAFSARPRPDRSIVFLAVTGEEQGLLGSHYYATRPLYPPANTVAAINMDGLNVWGRTRDITVVGMGQSSLDDLARRLAMRQGRVLVPEPDRLNGYLYRSDHFEMAKIGIPFFFPDTGSRFVNRPADWGRRQRERYLTEDYHRPSDEVKAWYDLSGMVEDLDLLFDIGSELASSEEWPEWSESSEFRAPRSVSR
jgi:Zn-dependent M28 family amino/carboxypeptidase